MRLGSNVYVVDGSAILNNISCGIVKYSTKGQKIEVSSVKIELPSNSFPLKHGSLASELAAIHMALLLPETSMTIVTDHYRRILLLLKNQDNLIEKDETLFLIYDKLKRCVTKQVTFLPIVSQLNESLHKIADIAATIGHTYPQKIYHYW